MESIDLKMFDTCNTDNLHKSAIIYRDESASFIYVCYDCGRMFYEITETLQHIESHFQLGNVVDQYSENSKDDLVDCFAVNDMPLHNDVPLPPTAPEYVNVKEELFDDNDVKDCLTLTKPTFRNKNQEFRCRLCNSVQQSNLQTRLHALNEHILEPMKCSYCKKLFNSGVDFESHLEMHMAMSEVNWKSITDGIHTSVKIDWARYESNNLWNNKEIIKRKSKKIPADVKICPGEQTRPYRCHKCSQTFSHFSDLRSHFKKHRDDEFSQKYRCMECDCHYETAYALRIHVLKIHMNVKKVRCNSCAEQFNLSNPVQFEKHLQQHNGPEKKLWIDIRDGIYHQQSNFTKYEETDSAQYPCQFCANKYYLKSNLDEHMKTANKIVHSGQSRMQCGVCNAILHTPKYYYAHQLEHKRVGPIITERDDTVLLANLDACVDELIATNEHQFGKQSFTCLICNFTHDKHCDVRAHARKLHIYKTFPPPMVPKKEFLCDLCGARFTSKNGVRRHIEIHTNTKAYPCTICGKAFRLNSSREIHERQHTGEKPYQCAECGKAFISKGILTAHSKRHESTTYPCHICGKVFNLPTGYRSHIKTHRQDRSYKCTVCPKTFNTRLYLMRHLVIHSDKKYKCHYCDSEFNTGAGRRQHHRHKHKT